MRRIPIAVMAVVFALVAPARGTTILPMPLGQVAREAARIVHGTVVDVRSGPDEGGLAATWVTVAVARAVKGAVGTQLVFKQYGVSEPLDDGTVARVAGLPRYVVGEEIVLFLRADSRSGFTSPVGFGQGTYRVERRGGRAVVHADAPARGRRDLDGFL